MNPAVFRMYDVRGVVDRDLTEDLVRDLGRAYGTRIRRDGGRRVCLGRDPRLHGQRLQDAFAEGALETGLTLLDVGVVPSPQLYFAVHHLDADGGVQVTGSHNPPEYNGVKMMRGKRSLYGDQIQELRAWIEAGDFHREAGGERVSHPITDAYLDYVVDNLELGPHRPRLVLDGGNGAGGPTAMRLFQRLGLDPTGLYIDMDGAFPNHHPDPTVPANLQDLRARVRADGADLGVAYDGDADRVGVIDDRGEVIWGDRLLILLARAVLAQEPGAAIVGEVKCSATLFEDIAAHGGRPIMSAVGHSIIKERMRAEGALLAGEMSGHIFFGHRWLGFDDAVYASARLVELLSHAGQPLSALLSDVPRTAVTPEIRLDCPDDRKFDIVSAAVEHYRAHPDVRSLVDIDGARVDFGDGWGLIRASNTQPVLVLRAEARDEARLDEIRQELEGFVAQQLAKGPA